jgi:hypothetical protein
MALHAYFTSATFPPAWLHHAPVGQERNLISRHIDSISVAIYAHQHATTAREWHQEAALSFRWNYPDQV